MALGIQSQTDPRVGPLPPEGDEHWTESQQKLGLNGPGFVPEPPPKSPLRPGEVGRPDRPEATKKFKVTIMTAPVAPADHSVLEVSVNGVELKIPRNKEVVLDESWVEAIKGSTEGKFLKIEEVQHGRSIR